MKIAKIECEKNIIVFSKCVCDAMNKLLQENIIRGFDSSNDKSRERWV